MHILLYSSITIFGMVTMMVFALILVSAAVYQLVKRRVRRATAGAIEANAILQQALSMSDHLIVELNLTSNLFRNVHGNQLPADGVPLADIRQLVHPEALEIFDNFIEQMRSGDKREATLSYLFNVNYGEGDPVWHQVRNNAILEYNQQGQPATITFTMTDLTDEARHNQKGDEMSQRYQDLFEDSIIGISFYNADGYLIDCNKMMREICNFESRYDSFYYDSCIFDLASYPNLSRERVEEFWCCMKLDSPKRDVNKYVELHVHPINDSKGRLQYIAMVARDITEERNLYMQSKLNDEQIRKASQEIRRYEEQLRYLLENSKMLVWRSTFDSHEIEFLQDLQHPVVRMPFEDFLDTLQTDEQEAGMLRLTRTVAERPANTNTITRPFKNLLVNDDKVYWYTMNSIPNYNEQGVQTGYFGLIRDITELIEEQEMLKQETERANDSDRMKSLFLANMTHEIRTPLNAIVGFSDLLQTIEAPEEKKEMMRIIRNNCDMLLRLINDFLAFSTIETNGVNLTPAAVNFADAFDDLCVSLAQRTADTAVAFIKDNPYTLLNTTLDMERIGQVITNFVTNAVKYTTQGHIKVGYRAEQRDGHDGLYIYCEDTGAGIPKAEQERIFDRFVKLNDYVQGTGLGLSISKAIVKCCQGQIGVTSEVGQGSTFWFWIPCEW